MKEFCGFVPESRFFLAPMAGVTDEAFRGICAGYGAAVTYTEMVSAKALTYDDRKTAGLLLGREEKRPAGVQLFGHEPDVMAEAAQRVCDLCAPTFIDVNMGCPVPKIVRNGDGSALMADPALAASVISAMKQAVSVPVTAKFRSGITEDSRNCAEFAKALEAAGADALCIHGRTRTQLYSGKSDRSMIAAVKHAVSVPVIASGDAWTASDCVDILSETGADFIMIARGSEGNPMIFSDCAALDRGEPLPVHTPQELFSVMRDHVRLACEKKGERRAMPELRKHMLWYLSRLSGARPFKTRMAMISSQEEFLSLCGEIEKENLSLKE